MLTSLGAENPPEKYADKKSGFGEDSRESGK